MSLFWIGIVIHVSLCFLLILLVLVQNDKSASGLGALSGMASGTLGSAGAATFIQKLTRGVAILFMLVVFLLSLNVSNAEKAAPTSQLRKAATGLGSVIPDASTPGTVTAPAEAPVAPTSAP